MSPSDERSNVLPYALLAIVGAAGVAFAILFFMRGRDSGCRNDQDCKGDRVCSKGLCTDAVSSTPTVPVTTEKPVVVSDASADDAAADVARAPVQAKCDVGMAYVSGGSGTMGTDEPGSVSKDLTGFEMDRRGWKPRHSVTLSPYCMDVTEVTVGKYKACVDDGKCTAPGKDSGDENNTYPNKTGYPISLVDWQQAKKFCEAYGHQLPSEAQWEFAARGPDAHEYPFAWTSSDNITCTDSLANESGGKKLVAGFGEGSRCAKTAHGAWSVGSAPDGKSPFGMFDMAGNVMEWVLDDYDLGYYEQSKGAKDPVNLKSTGAKSMGVVRGGGWSHGGGNGDKAPGWTMHAWFREPQPRDAQDAEIGFRCVAQPKG